MSNESTLNKASGFFFFSGFLLSKFQYAPFAIASSITNLVALVLYMIGYGLWFIGVQKSAPNPKWSPFINFKEKFLHAAILGLLATTVSILAIINPLFLIPAGWIYFISNILWTKGEYYKLNASYDNESSPFYQSQSNYFNYSIAMSTIGFVTATATTLSLLVPAIALPVIILSAIMCLGLGALAFEYWIESKTVTTFNSDIELHELSHSKMQHGLGLGMNPSASYENGNNLFADQSSSLPDSNEYSDSYSSDSYSSDSYSSESESSSCNAP